MVEPNKRSVICYSTELWEMKNALRWILTLPLGILSMLAVTGIIRMSNHLAPSRDGLSDEMISFWCGAAFTLVCGTVAPAYSRAVSVAAGCLLLLPPLWLHFSGIASAETLTLSVATIVGAAAGIFVLFRGNW
jgi:hypothetical protein